MKQYIDKSALIAEIRSLQDSTVDEEGNFYTAKAQAEYNVLCMLESFLNALEVKELPTWKKSTLPHNNVTGFNSDYFTHDGYYINYKELFEVLPKDE